MIWAGRIRQDNQKPEMNCMRKKTLTKISEFVRLARTKQLLMGGLCFLYTCSISITDVPVATCMYVTLLESVFIVIWVTVKCGRDVI